MALNGAMCAQAGDDGGRNGDDTGDVSWTTALRRVVHHVRDREATLTEVQNEVAQAYVDLMRRLTATVRDAPAEQVRAAFAELINDTDRAILRGLDHGPRATLESRTGVTRSVIDRRLPRLHLLAGTVTQFQLGRAASALGWLDPAPDD